MFSPDLDLGKWRFSNRSTPDNAQFVRRAPVGYFRIFTALHRSCSQFYVTHLATRHITVSGLLRLLWFGVEHELYELLDLVGARLSAAMEILPEMVFFTMLSISWREAAAPFCSLILSLYFLINLILDRFQTRLLLLHLEKICTALGVTLSQFFQEDNSENLTEEQEEVLRIWNDLNTNEQETVMSMLRGLRK